MTFPAHEGPSSEHSSFEPLTMACVPARPPQGIVKTESARALKTTFPVVRSMIIAGEEEQFPSMLLQGGSYEHLDAM